MNKIILQNETITKKIKAFINTLAKNSKIYDAFNEKQINIIRDNIINLAEENNYWQTIFNSQGTSENSDNDSDDALDSIVFQSECNKLFNLILEQSSTIDTPTDNNSISTPEEDNAKSKKDSSTQKKDENIEKALEDAKNQTSDETITLIVTGKNNFQFVNNKNERFQSKESLQKIEAFLKANTNILKDKIQANKKEKAENTSKNIDFAIEFINNTLLQRSKTLKPFSGKLNESELKQILNSFDTNDIIWDKATENYTFGDGITDRNEVQKQFYIVCGALICWHAATYFGKSASEIQQDNAENTKNKNMNKDVNWESLSPEQVADLIEEKIKKAGKNPKDKSYLQSLADNKNWNDSKSEKYQKALTILMNRA